MPNWRCPDSMQRLIMSLYRGSKMCSGQATAGIAIEHTKIGITKVSTAASPLPAAASALRICSPRSAVSAWKCRRKMASILRFTGIWAPPWPSARPSLRPAATARAFNHARYGDKSFRHIGHAGRVSKAWSRVRARHGLQTVWPQGIVVGSQSNPRHSAHSNRSRTHAASSWSTPPKPNWKSSIERTLTEERPLWMFGQMPSRNQAFNVSAAVLSLVSFSSHVLCKKTLAASTSCRMGGLAGVAAAHIVNANKASAARCVVSARACPKRNHALAHIGPPTEDDVNTTASSPSATAPMLSPSLSRAIERLQCSTASGKGKLSMAAVYASAASPYLPSAKSAFARCRASAAANAAGQHRRVSSDSTTFVPSPKPADSGVPPHDGNTNAVAASFLPSLCLRTQGRHTVKPSSSVVGSMSKLSH
mmetsp:Transcript_57624/g.160556  ORF Transcript_57624/g.160556 Transcript_57624/m.160556 type:complete len:420 (+) Transcript_57624:786-2045(+)